MLTQINEKTEKDEKPEKWYVELLRQKFDKIMADGKITADEAKKIQKLKDAGLSSKEIIKKGAMAGLMSNPVKGSEGISLNDFKDKNNDENKEKEDITKITLTNKDQAKIEQNILNLDKNKKLIAFDKLSKVYNELDTKKTESFDQLSKQSKLLTDEQMIIILNMIYSKYKKDMNESLLYEVANKKIKNTIVSKEWVKRGSKLDKNNIIKLMKYFKMTDLQIYAMFEKINKDLTYEELQKFDINIKKSSDVVTVQDLEKFGHTLGKFKLKQFLIKFKKSISGK